MAQVTVRKEGINYYLTFEGFDDRRGLAVCCWFSDPQKLNVPAAWPPEPEALKLLRGYRRADGSLYFFFRQHDPVLGLIVSTYNEENESQEIGRAPLNASGTTVIQLTQ